MKNVPLFRKSHWVLNQIIRCDAECHCQQHHHIRLGEDGGAALRVEQAAEDQQRPVPQIQRVADLAHEDHRPRAEQVLVGQRLAAGLDDESGAQSGEDGPPARVQELLAQQQREYQYDGNATQRQNVGDAGVGDCDCLESQQSADCHLPEAGEGEVEVELRVDVHHDQVGDQRQHCEADQQFECLRRELRDEQGNDEWPENVKLLLNSQ